MAIIQTGTIVSGNPSCLSTARISRPALAMMHFMMSRWRLMLLSMGSSLQPCRAILSFIMMTPFGRRLFLQRNRKFVRSLSVRWPEERDGDKTQVTSLYELVDRLQSGGEERRWEESSEGSSSGLTGYNLSRSSSSDFCPFCFEP